MKPKDEHPDHCSCAHCFNRKAAPLRKAFPGGRLPGEVDASRSMTKAEVEKAREAGDK